MRIVNGYVCECSDEARLARRGVDPANPHNDPLVQRELDAKRGKIDPRALDETKPGDLDPNRRDPGAVLFGGALAGADRQTKTAAVTPPLVDKLV